MGLSPSPNPGLHWKPIPGRPCPSLPVPTRPSLPSLYSHWLCICLHGRYAPYLAGTVLEEYLDDFRGVLVVVSHDRWFCDRVLAPPILDDDDPDAGTRRSSLFVFEGDGAVSQYRGVYSEYFAALKTGSSAEAGLTESITGFASPPPLPVTAAPPPPASNPKPAAKAKAETNVASVSIADMANIGLRAPPPLPPLPPSTPDSDAKEAGPSQRQMAKKIEQETKKKVKKVKVSKKDRKEYETIEAEVEALEIAAAEAEAALEEANNAARRLSTNEMMDLASAASDARRAADLKMERYIELEELIAEADA